MGNMMTTNWTIDEDSKAMSKHQTENYITNTFKDKLLYVYDPTTKSWVRISFRLSLILIYGYTGFPFPEAADAHSLRLEIV